MTNSISPSIKRNKTHLNTDGDKEGPAVNSIARPYNNHEIVRVLLCYHHRYHYDYWQQQHQHQQQQQQQLKSQSSVRIHPFVLYILHWIRREHHSITNFLLHDLIGCRVHLRHRPGGRIDCGIDPPQPIRQQIERLRSRTINGSEVYNTTNTIDNSATDGSLLQTLRQQWLAPPHLRPYDAQLVKSFTQGRSSYTEDIPCGTGSGAEWTVRITRSRLMGKGTVDARDRTHVGWKRDLNLTRFAGQELPEALFGDSSVEIRWGRRIGQQGGGDGNGNGGGDEDDDGNGGGVRISFCALDALRCWALLDHPPPPHLSELRTQTEEGKNVDYCAKDFTTNDSTNTSNTTTAINDHNTNGHNTQQQIGKHGWDYTFTTTYPGSTDTLPLGTDLPKHPGPGRRCDSLHPRPAIDLVTATKKKDDDGTAAEEGRLQLRKALCKCVDSRVFVLGGDNADGSGNTRRSGGSSKTKSGFVNTTAVDPSAAAMGVWIPPSSASTSSTTSSKVSSAKSRRFPKPPFPQWTKPIHRTDYNDRDQRPNKTATDVFTLLLHEYALMTGPSLRSLPPPRVETIDLWLDNLDPHSLSFLRLSVLVVPDLLLAVQLRCFVRVNGVMARVVDTKLTCRFEEGRRRPRCKHSKHGRKNVNVNNDEDGSTGTETDVWVVHRERSWREGNWSQFLGSNASSTSLMAPQGRHGEKEKQQKMTLLRPLSDFGGCEDRIAHQRLPMIRPTKYDELVIPRLVEARDGNTMMAVPEMLWRRKLRCQNLHTTTRVFTPVTRIKQKPSSPVTSVDDCSATLSPMVVLVGNDGHRIEAIDALTVGSEHSDATNATDDVGSNKDNKDKHPHTLWSRVVPDNTAVLIVALSPMEVLHVSSNTGHRRCTRRQLLALGTEQGTVLLWDAATGKSMASFPVSIPRPLSTSSRTTATLNPNNIRYQVASGWVEQLCWNKDGSRIAAAAGRVAVVASVNESEEQYSLSTDSAMLTKRYRGSMEDSNGADENEGATLGRTVIEQVGMITVKIISGEEAPRTHSIGTVSGTVTDLSHVVGRRDRSEGVCSVENNEAEDDHFVVGGYGGARWLSSVTETIVNKQDDSGDLFRCQVLSQRCSSTFCGNDVAGYGNCHIDDDCFVKGTGDSVPHHFVSSPTSPLIIGATATLAVSASPDGTQITVGCLDKRMRIFTKSAAHVVVTSSHSTYGNQHGSKFDQIPKPNHATSIFKSAEDWVGFDGPVNLLTWSSYGSYLAAAGGTTLLVVSRSRTKGDPPVRCIFPRTNGCGAVGALAWTPGSFVEEEGLLGVIEAGSGHVHVFVVSPPYVDISVPRRAFPLYSIAPLGIGSSMLVQLVFVVRNKVKLLDDDEKSYKNGDGKMHRRSISQLGILIGHGDWTAAYTIPTEKILVKKKIDYHIN